MNIKSLTVMGAFAAILSNRSRRWLAWMLLLILGGGRVLAEPAAGAGANGVAGINVTGYQLQGKYPLPVNTLSPLLAPYVGTNVSLAQILQAAVAVETAYVQAGYPAMNIVVSPRIKDGVITLDVFPGAVPQVVLAGCRYSVATHGETPLSDSQANFGFRLEAGVGGGDYVLSFNRSLMPTGTNAAKAAARPAKRFTVNNYQVSGNTLLPPDRIGQVLTNVPGAFGTNVSLDNIQDVVMHLRAAYSERGYATVYVGLPQQRLTNAVVKVEVVEGRLSSITVKGNRYFSTENVRRSMPGLHTNMILNSLTFQAELNRANANQDRQIYPVIEPGPDPGTSDLVLEVKDRVPFHVKTELNNQNSPGTPDLRENTSAVYNNLWQQDQVLGVQYSFSPEQYKQGPQWNFYDLPSVANYSTFYRIPLGSPGALDDQIAADPGSFGYSEATHKFNLPPASGQPDLTFFASRSTIDNGLVTSPSQNVFTSTTTNTADGTITTNNTLNKYSMTQNLTVNNDLGLRLNIPLEAPGSFHHSISGGVDFKTYAATSTATNVNQLSQDVIDTLSGGIPTTNHNNSTIIQSLPMTYNEVYYLPLSVRYDCGWEDGLGTGSFGVGVTVNPWYSALNQTIATDTNNVSSTHYAQALHAITGSTESSGHWVALTPSFSHTFTLVTNWVTTVRADGQWVTEPVISNEQFGAGGVNSVRGYQEGEVFGDTGWHVSLEQQTPPHTMGMIAGRIPLVVRGTIYSDYATVYSLVSGNDTELWGTGMGCVISLGSFWETRFLFSVPLLGTTTTTAYHPFFNVSLTGQF